MLLNKGCKISRRRLGMIRIAVIVAGFACLVHFTHRECAKNTDRPVRNTAVPASSAASKKTPQAHKDPEAFHATAYCVSGITAAGVPAAPGVVSADPRVIPLGSMIYIESPLVGGIYQVMDTGDLIKGKIIDIFMPSYDACVEFGRRAVKVKVLRYGFKGESAKDKKPAK